MAPTMNARLSYDSPIAVTPLTFKAPLTMSFKSPFLKNPLYEKHPVAVNLAPAAMHHREEKGEIPSSPVAKVRQLGSDLFSSWKHSMQSPKPDNAARARQISQELCSPSNGPSQDVLLLRKALRQERKQKAKMATSFPSLVPPPTASSKSVPSPNKKAQQISQELCFTIDTPPGTPAKSVHLLKEIALEPHSPYWKEGELTAPWDSFYQSQEMLMRNAVIKKTSVAFLIPEPPSQDSEDYQGTAVHDDNNEGEKRQGKAESSKRNTLVRQALDAVHNPLM
jgi:hypothetical protein